MTTLVVFLFMFNFIIVYLLRDSRDMGFQNLFNNAMAGQARQDEKRYRALIAR